MSDHEEQPIRTLQEYLHPTSTATPSCIMFRPNAPHIDFKLEMIQYLPTFHRLGNENPYVHVTEFDISATSQSQAASAYKDYFNMLKKYGKNYSGSHKITNVTVWGISSEDSWINKGSQYPLLFNRSGSNYYTNSAFDAVIAAAE